MLKSLSYLFVPKQLSCRHTTRYKDYKTIWKKHGILEDWQNLGNKSPTLTEKWQAENNDVTDISRLPKFLRNRKSDVMKLSHLREHYETTVDYQRATYAFYGNASNIDPGEVCWPSPKAIDLLKDREENYEPKFKELMDNAKYKNEQKQAAIIEFQNRVKKNLVLLPGLISQYEKKQNKAIEDASLKEKNRQNLIREAREYYGFTISFQDPRMEKFREMKLAEAKKKSKDEKKKLRNK